MTTSRKRPGRRPRALIIAITTALVATLPVPILAVTAAPAAAAGPVSGAIGLGDGLSGSIDERTGLFSASVPLVTVAGPGSAGVTWSLLWDQGRAADGVDRSGLGAGWSLGASFIDPATPVTVYPANGGAYRAGGSYPSGLQNYPLQDLVYAKTSGAYTLTYDDGRVDSFDEHGNLINRVDRFGNRTQLTWQALRGGGWQPVTIVDGYGLTTTFTYTQNSVKVSAPARSDGVVATTTVALDAQQRIRSVTDPTGASATFGYAPVPGSPAQLLTSVVSAAQARTTITYTDVAQQPGLSVVQSLITVDSSGGVVGPARLFSLNPPENVGDHNYTGYPTYNGGDTDQLFTSGSDYTYTTAISSCVVTQPPAPQSCPNSQQTTVSTYDSQHRLVDRTIKAGQVTVQHQVNGYVPVKSSNLDPNYARPKTTAVTYSATSDATGFTTAAGSRTATANRLYDSHGRVQSSTDENGTTTVTSYDSTYGLIAGTTITGADGSQSQTINTLSADNKTIQSSTISYASPGQPLSARSTTTYEYDTAGQLSNRTVTWTPNAKPANGGSGPDSIASSFTSAVDAGARTRTITTTTAAGTPQAASSQTVIDLVTGSPVRSIDPLGRVTTYRYDAGGRQTGRTTPDGLTSTSTYTAATSRTPPSRTDRTPDGRTVLTTFDALGRTLRVTDNVKAQSFTGNPATRQLSAFTYSLDGTRVTAVDQQGRTIDTTLDALGRQVSQIGVTGITHSSAYDDAAHTVTGSVTGTGAASADATRTATYDNANRAVTVNREYGDGTTAPVESTGYDGLGRVVSQTSDDLTLSYGYLGAGGTSTSQTATPQDQTSFPGEPLDLTDGQALGGQQTTSQRAQPGVADSTSQGTAQTYDAAGRVSTSTDPLGRATTYTYYPDGRVATRTTPEGTVVTDTYDAVTGRLLQVTATAPGRATVTLTYGYVPAGQPGAGRIASYSDGADTVTLTYDADGHVVSRSYSDGTATSAGYTDGGLLDTTVDVTGAVTTYQYDGVGRLTSATQSQGKTVLSSVSYTYDAMSRVHTTTRGNGLVTTNTWTSRNQLLDQRTTNPANAVVEEHAYTYDSHGNVATRTDTVPGVSASPSPVGTWTTVYRYDAYDRLLGSDVRAGTATTGPTTASTSYVVNTAGDVVSSTSTSPTTSATASNTTATNTIDAAGQLTAQVTDGTTVQQAFNNDGQVTTSLTGWGMSYDAFGRVLTASKAGTTSSYAYWPDGTRRSTTTQSPAASVCDQAIAQAGTGKGTYGRYRLVRAPQRGGSHSDVVVGTDGPDHLIGGSGNDVLCGLGGDDVLKGGSGNDYLDGGPGTNRLSGGSGNDTLVNGAVNDGGSGRNTIGAPAATQTFHYGADGVLVNDTTAGAATAATTASYLLTAGREARVLQPGTSPVGALPRNAPAPVTTGAGAGYLLRDRHSSVTALVDSTGATTSTYGYGDYGQPALPDGRLQASPPAAPSATVNPFQWTGATPASSITDPTTGYLLLPARSYDPSQGRFVARDTANVFNHYQGFSTNPIVFVDPTGHFSLTDLLVDIGTFLIFAVAVVATGGAALAASTVVTTVALAITAAASATGAVATAVKVADDVDDAVTGKHFLSPSGRKAIGIVQAVAGAVAAVSGLAAVGAASAGAISAADSGLTDVDEFFAYKRFAVEDDSFNNPPLEQVGKIPYDSLLGNDESFESAEVPSYDVNDAKSAADTVIDGPSARGSLPRPATVQASEPIPVARGVLRTVLGGGELPAPDAAIIGDDPGLSRSLSYDDAAEDSAGDLTAAPARGTLQSPHLSAVDGNWVKEADVYGVGKYSNDILSNLGADDRATFMGYFTRNSFSGSSFDDLPITQGQVLGPVPVNN